MEYFEFELFSRLENCILLSVFRQSIDSLLIIELQHTCERVFFTVYSFLFRIFFYYKNLFGN